MYFLEFSDNFDVQSIVFPYSRTIGHRFIAMLNLSVPNDISMLRLMIQP